MSLTNLFLVCGAGAAVGGSLNHRDMQKRWGRRRHRRGRFQHIASALQHRWGQPLRDDLHLIVRRQVGPRQLWRRWFGGIRDPLQHHTWTRMRGRVYRPWLGQSYWSLSHTHLRKCTQRSHGPGRHGNAPPSHGSQSGRPGVGLWCLSGRDGSGSEIGHSRTTGHTQRAWRLITMVTLCQQISESVNDQYFHWET